ncbi:MAG: serine hydrolase domain-containing protein [Pseudomonadota bacterium]
MLAESKAEIHGDFEEAYRPAVDAFESNFEHEQEIGASFCLYRDGKKVVDIWAGHQDEARTKPWEKDTLVNVWSTTKGMMALCIGRLVDQGLLDYQAPVAKYWPEFAVNGKENITVAQLMSHQAGLCGTSRAVSQDEFIDTDLMAMLLAAETPHWEVGANSGYHALSIGPLTDELVKRVTGKTLGAYFRDEIAEPFGIDFHMGLPPEENDRVATLVHDGGPQAGGPEHFNEYQNLAYNNIPVEPSIGNRLDWRAQGTPAAGGQSNARAVAQIYSALSTDRKIDGVEIISQDGLDAATKIQIQNKDLVLRVNVCWSAGFVVNSSTGIFGPSPSAFGHGGWGGSFAFADPANRIGVAYTMNFMREFGDKPDSRIYALIDGVYKSL